MSRHHDDMGGLPEAYIAPVNIAIRTIWTLAYGLALVIVGIIQTAYDNHRDRGSNSKPEHFPTAKQPQSKTNESDR